MFNQLVVLLSVTMSDCSVGGGGYLGMFKSKVEALHKLHPAPDMRHQVTFGSKLVIFDFSLLPVLHKVWSYASYLKPYNVYGYGSLLQ